jgi:hypothetical protein
MPPSLEDACESCSRPRCSSQIVQLHNAPYARSREGDQNEVCPCSLCMHVRLCLLNGRAYHRRMLSSYCYAKHWWRNDGRAQEGAGRPAPIVDVGYRDTGLYMRCTTRRITCLQLPAHEQVRTALMYPELAARACTFVLVLESSMVSCTRWAAKNSSVIKTPCTRRCIHVCFVLYARI